ncbi:alpha-ketoglutarate-dependent dioxygenase AlkB [Shigella sonnei]
MDPQTNKPWPAMRQSFPELCQRAATAAGYPDFQPDACLINRYAPRAKLSLHQDKDKTGSARADCFLFLWAYPRFFNLAA